MNIRLKYVVRDVDRHGNIRFYYRRAGQNKVRLRGPEDSPEFVADYMAAVAGVLQPKSNPTSLGRVEADSLRSVCICYFKSAEFLGLQPTTQRVRRGILERLCEKDGSKPFSQLRPQHMKARRDALADTPEAANALIKALRQLFKFAVETGLTDHNYASEVKYLSGSTDGFHAWTIEEIRQFEKRHPVGSSARLAFALLLYTGQRREDIRKLGPGNLKNGSLVLRQDKNHTRKPVDLILPIVPELRFILDRSILGKDTFITTEHGRPFASGTSFYNRFKKWCVEAGLPHCSPHGLRKAAASRLAEMGCSELEIMSITGHRTSKEVARYTRSARQKVLAESASSKLIWLPDLHQIVPPSIGTNASGTIEATNPLADMDDLEGMVPRGGRASHGMKAL